ncbi:nucleoside hydrolase [Parapedobacter deserti]|uniref:Nucleoside hydrolase n=1 Tax=Parapedobacter deserti TaxID=1912957 RepID=A0ABV7JRB0_9SPHI
MVENLKVHLIIFFLVGCFISSTSVLADPIKVILDTDIDSDVDDVGALAMLHTLADHDVVKILGVIVTSNDTYAPSCADAINHYYKRPAIPIGVQKGLETTNFSKYTRQISEEFPHRISSYEDAEDAISLYRRILASQEDQSVVIISIGHLTNLRLLLESHPDEHSMLSGTELVKAKVRMWSAMGGKFPAGKEANFYRPDPESTVVAIANWPTRVVFAGWETGNKVITGGEFLRKSLKQNHPVWRAYHHYNNFEGRQSWDQLSVLYAVSSAPDDYWDLQYGEALVHSDGSNGWKMSSEVTNQAFLVEKADPTEVAKIIDALMVGLYKPGF